MNIAVGTANATYLSPADLRRLFSEVLSPTSSLLDLTSTSFTLKDPTSQNYLVATGSGFVFDAVTQALTGGTITSIDFFEGANPTVSFFDLQIDAATFYTSLSDSTVPNPLYEDYAYNILGSTGNDILYGGDGTLNETFNGSDGIDTLTYEDAAFGGVTVNLQAGTGIKPGGGVDTISYIENVTGSAQADVLIGDAAANVLSGGAGNDNIYGNGGDDTLVGGRGDDFIDGGLGFDTAVYYGNRSDYTITQNAENGRLTIADNRGLDGTDTLLNVNRVQFADQLFAGLTTLDLVIPGVVLTGTEGADTLTGNEGADTIYGLGGNDTLVGGDGADTIYGGLGNDNVVGGTGGGSLFGEAGDDVLTLLGVGGIANGGDGDDILTGIGKFYGDAGNDYIIGVNGSAVFGGGRQ